MLIKAAQLMCFLTGADNQYSKPLKEVQKAKQLLRVRSFTAVGEKTFEYYMRYEGDKE